MLQGVIDCFLIEQDGITVLDFKTDYVTQETVYARAEEYRGQLDAYAQALERMYHLPVKEKLLSFFAVHTAVSM